MQLLVSREVHKKYKVFDKSTVSIAVALIPVKDGDERAVVVKPIYKDGKGGIKWCRLGEVIGAVAETHDEYTWWYKNNNLYLQVNEYFVRKCVSGGFPALDPYNILGWLVLSDNSQGVAYLLIISAYADDMGSHLKNITGGMTHLNLWSLKKELGQ